MSSLSKKARLENLSHDDKQPLPCIPEHVIFSKILPFLSFNGLAKLKCVCKNWCSFISSNPMLPLDRFRHRVSSYSGVAFSHCTPSGKLVFLPTLRGGPVDAPDFLNVSFSQQPCKEILASTNGLLCLQCDNDSIYVCNPLTKEGHIIPLSKSWQNTPDISVWRSSIGLAYDPSKSPAQYKLVCPWSDWSDYERGRYALGFEVFSSETNQWDKSCKKYDVDRNYLNITSPTYAGGVLYWNCIYRLVYFDPEKDDGGTVPMPFDSFDSNPDQHEIGEFEGHVTCSRVSTKGMQLWIMDVNRSGWEMMHWVSFETLIENNPYVFRSCFYLNMPLQSRTELEIMFHRFRWIPLPYGGGERLFVRALLWRTWQDKVLCYDVKSRKLMKFCTLPPAANYRPIDNPHVFLYQGSMVSLPKLGRASFDREP